LLVAAAASTAGEPSLTAELATRNAFLGDPVELNVRIQHDPTYQVLTPQPGKTLGDATVLGLELVPAGTGAEKRSHTLLRLKLAWYRLGAFKVPPLNIQLEGSGLAPITLSTPELNIEIVNMLTEEDQAAAPPKEQVALPIPSLLPVVLGGLVLLALIVGGIMLWLRRDKVQAPPPPKPPKPPYDEAIEALRNCGSHLKEGHVKEFYVAVNLIVRRYYARLFHVHAEEMTSFEVEAWLEDHAARLPGELFYLNRAFQEPCDRVKFAKHDPVEAENKETLNRAYQIVELLKPAPVQGVAKKEDADVAAG